MDTNTLDPKTGEYTVQKKDNKQTQDDKGFSLLVSQENIIPGALKQRHFVPSPTAKGDMYYGKDGNSFGNLPIGTSGQVLKVVSGLPVWSDVSTWTNYDCTPSGWAATPTQIISQYAIVGNICHLNINVTGTSNAVTTVIHAPFTAVGVDSGTCMFFLQNNSVILTTPGSATVRGGSTTIDCYRDLSGAAWTAANTKQVQFCLFYPI